jgi:hypothetical protein
MYRCFHVDSFKVAILQAVPVPDGLSDRLAALGLLNSIVADLPGDGLVVAIRLVVAIHGHERASCYAIRRLYYDRAGALAAKERLDRSRNRMEVVLGPARGAAAGLRLLQMHPPLPRDRDFVIANILPGEHRDDDFKTARISSIPDPPPTPLYFRRPNPPFVPSGGNLQRNVADE